MNTRNPFVVLGLTPETIKGLTDEKIRALVNQVWRAQSTIHHPDKGGKEKRFKELTTAKDQLEDPESFQEAKMFFLKPKKDQLADLTKQLEETRKKVDDTWNTHAAFWAASLGLGIASEQYPIVNPPNMAVLVSPILEANRDARQNRDVESFRLGEERRFVLKVQGGVIQKIPLKRTMIKNLNEIPAGTLAEYRGSRYFLSETEAKPYEARLIGALPQYTGGPRAESQFFLEAKTPEALIDVVDHGLPLNSFRPIMQNMLPFFGRYSFLLGAFRLEKDIRFTIVGRVQNVRLLESF